MKIVLATGIYPPEIGGHSFYVQSLEIALKKMGHDVRIVIFGHLKGMPTGIRHCMFALRLWRAARQADVVIGFDTFTVAIPLGLIAPFLKAKVFQRAGGDFVWETYIARTKDMIPLPEFYAHKERWSRKERFSFRLIRFALRRVRVVFSSEWLRDLWREPYALDSARVHVIENAIPRRIPPEKPTRKNFMLYGRQIALKNADLFRKAFARAKKEHPELEFDQGSVSRELLFERLRAGYVAVVPSISEVTPNYVIESIICGKPFLLTKYSGYAERFKDFGVIVDPLSEDDLLRGILELADDATYKKLCKKIAAFSDVRTYDDIATEFVALIERL